MQTVFFASIHLAGKPLPAMDRQTTSIVDLSYFVFRSHFPVSSPLARRSLQVLSQLETLLVPIRFLFRFLFCTVSSLSPPLDPCRLFVCNAFSLSVSSLKGIEISQKKNTPQQRSSVIYFHLAAKCKVYFPAKEGG